MRKSLQCPKCEGRKVWRIERLLERGDPRSGGYRPVPLALTFSGNAWFGLKGTGALELFACARCGYAELYADTTGLEPNPDRGVHLIDNEPGARLR